MSRDWRLGRHERQFGKPWCSQETQWEAPQEAFQPLDWSPAPCPASQIDVTSNPFLEAIASYRSHHSFPCEVGSAGEGGEEGSPSQFQDESKRVHHELCPDSEREVEPGAVQSTEEMSNNTVHCSTRQSGNHLPAATSNGEAEQTGAKQP